MPIPATTECNFYCLAPTLAPWGLVTQRCLERCRVDFPHTTHFCSYHPRQEDFDEPR